MWGQSSATVIKLDQGTVVSREWIRVPKTELDEVRSCTARHRILYNGMTLDLLEQAYGRVLHRSGDGFYKPRGAPRFQWTD
jgi:hypothetical protein